MKVSTVIFLLALILVSLFSTGCFLFGDDNDDPGRVYEQNECYSSTDIRIKKSSATQWSGLEISGGRNNRCDNNAVADIFLYASIGNATNDKTAETLTTLNILPNCEIRNFGGEHGWQKLDEFKIQSGDDEVILVVLCGRLSSQRSGPRVLDVADLTSSALHSTGPACDPALAKTAGGTYCNSTNVCTAGTAELTNYVHRGGFYSAVSGSSYSICAPTRVTVSNGNFLNSDLSAYCDKDGVCAGLETGGSCDDCSTCEEFASQYVQSGPTPNSANMKLCQGDWNPPGERSRNVQCKWCPRPYVGQPAIDARDYSTPFLGSVYPYLLPEDSYSTGVDEVARSGCVNVSAGSPFNCGVCGWGEEINDQSQAKKGAELTGAFCMGVGNEAIPEIRDRQFLPFCKEIGGEKSNKWACVSKEEGRASITPYFQTYSSVNPSYFYSVVDAGNGCYGASITTITPLAGSNQTGGNQTGGNHTGPPKEPRDRPGPRR